MGNFSEYELQALARHPVFDNRDTPLDHGGAVWPETADLEDQFSAPKIHIRSIGRGGYRAVCDCGGFDTNYLSDQDVAIDRAKQHSSATQLDPRGGHILIQPEVIE